MKKIQQKAEKIILKVGRKGCCHPFHKVRDNTVPGFRASRMLLALQKFCFLPVHETNKDLVAHGCVVNAKIGLY